MKFELIITSNKIETKMPLGFLVIGNYNLEQNPFCQINYFSSVRRFEIKCQKVAYYCILKKEKNKNLTGNPPSNIYACRKVCLFLHIKEVEKKKTYRQSPSNPLKQDTSITSKIKGKKKKKRL